MNPAVNSEALYDLGIMRREEQAFIRKGKRNKRLIQPAVPNPWAWGGGKNKWGRDGGLGVAWGLSYVS